jgi:uncharacterized protein (TIGR00251 family)
MIHATAEGCTLRVRVQPGAKKTAITGIYPGTGDENQAALKIAVHAPPLEGRANQVLMEFLAKTLRLPKSSIQLIAGSSSRNKLFLLKGQAAAEAEAILRKAFPPEDHFAGTA